MANNIVMHASATFFITHANYIKIVHVGKERPTFIGPWSYLKRQHSLLELKWGLLALCRQTVGSERDRYVIARPDKVGTDPMAVVGINR